MKKKTSRSLAGLIVFGLTLLVGGQELPPLELTMRGDSLSFQLNSWDRNESWMLQQSSDGENWSDLVPLERGLGIIGFGVQIERRSLEGGNLDKRFFRAKQYSRHEKLNQTYLAALAKWNESEVTNYTYVVRSWAGMLSYEARYTVVDGEVTEVEVISAPLFGPVPDDLTVDDLFARVASAIENNAFEIDVDWDSDLGYPRRAYLDIDEWIADEERGWTISELTPLE